MDNNQLSANISSILRRLKIPQEHEGFHYLKQSIYNCIIYNNAKYITTSIYPKVATRFYTTIEHVENCISDVIEISWKEHQDTFLLQTFGFNDNKKPSNEEFIKIIARRLKPP